MNKLVIVVSNNFSKRDEKRFGISFCKKLGVKFEVINITYLIDKRRYEFKQYDHIEEAVYLINITSYKVFYDYVDNNIDATYLLLLGTSSFSEYKIFKYLEKSKCYTGIMALGVIPTTIYLRTLCEKIKRITYRKLIKKMINILFSKFFTFPKLNFIVSHSLLYAEEHQLYDKNNTKIVLSHTLDYDIFLEHKFTNNTIKPIAVFLDEYYPYHPDNINFIGYDISSIADNYYKLINLWFEELEKELNITVVIASHPRANPINQKYNFNGRKIYYNITEDLVSKSQLVLLHESTSINFAILHQKRFYNMSCIFHNLTNSKYYNRFLM
jgi:hypothetical protein